MLRGHRKTFPANEPLMEMVGAGSAVAVTALVVEAALGVGLRCKEHQYQPSEIGSSALRSPRVEQGLTHAA
jgi:hypothetical protein